MAVGGGGGVRKVQLVSAQGQVDSQSCKFRNLPEGISWENCLSTRETDRVYSRRRRYACFQLVTYLKTETIRTEPSKTIFDDRLELQITTKIEFTDKAMLP